jgi:hypothetical protein
MIPETEAVEATVCPDSVEESVAKNSTAKATNSARRPANGEDESPNIVVPPEWRWLSTECFCDLKPILLQSGVSAEPSETRPEICVQFIGAMSVLSITAISVECSIAPQFCRGQAHSMVNSHDSLLKNYGE